MEPGICLVGTGGIASAHAEALARADRVVLRWVVGRTPEAAEQFAKRWRFARAGAALADALADEDVGIVIIASPSHLHFEQAAQSLRAGRHVIVEIPAALRLEDCEQLDRLAFAVGRRLVVCHTMRSFPALREVRALVARGAIDVSHVVGFFGIPRRANEGWSGTRSWIDNLLWHHACHQVDASLWALGLDSAGDVCARFGRPHPEFGMVTDLSLSFASATRQLITHALTYNIAHLLWELRFVTDGDLLIFRNGSLTDHTGAVLVPSVSVRDVSLQDEEILTALASGRASEFDLAAVMPTMRLLDLAEKAAQEAVVE